ncbi:CHAT domain-containing protein [Falsiroseomonas sp. CW058]|uniref:CHAT domain-containing protein n=1 Tax=Falsiroseomonas sp. CW058 TaxID=3388664 RepID=UPI003D31493C
MRAARRAVFALAAAALLPAPAAAQRGGDSAAAAMQDARALVARGEPEAALVRLERFLVAPRGAAEPDLLALRLEAARIAVAVGAPDHARTHLAPAERIANGATMRQEPVLTARLRREFARLRERIGDIAEAEALLGQALPPLVTADPAAAAEAVNARGALRLELLRLVDATGDFRRSLALLARLPGAGGEPQVAALTNLAIAQAESGEAAAALDAAARARFAAGADPRLLRAADLAEAQARIAGLDLPAADALLDRVAAESAADDPLRGHALSALARARYDRGAIAEAAEAAAAAVEAYRATIGERHPAFGRALHTLGTAQLELGDRVAAAASLARAAGVLRAALGPRSQQRHATEVERGLIDLRGGNPAEAARRAREALAAYAAAPPPDRRPEGLATILLGLAAEAEGRDAEAAAQFRRGQAMIEAARGPHSPDLGFSLVRLGRLLTRTGRLEEAAAPLDRAIGIYERIGGAGTVRLAEAVTARAELRARAGQRQGALEDARRGLALLRGRMGAVDTIGATAEAQRRGARDLFAAQARLLLDLLPGDAAAEADAFAATQEALTTRTGEAVRRAIARRAAGDGELGRLLRARQDAADALRQADSLVFAAATRSGAEAGRAATLFRAAREAAAARLRAANEALASGHPGQAAFLAPRPAALADVQAILGEDEALLAPLVTEDGLLLWLVRRGAVRALRLPMRQAEMAELVRRLREGLDLGRLDRGLQLAPFDGAAARALHAALFAPVVDGPEAPRHVILVPDGALQQLPPHLLADREGRWLVQRLAVTVAPSVAAAVAARAAAERGSQAPLAFLGVADPVFDRFADDARMARRGPPAGLRRQLAALDRLADTADEVRRIAGLLGEGDSRLVLRDAATERGVMQAEPRRFRVISFSTHALMAGELPGLAEPAIVLTADDDDAPMDGLLTASDVATLELDAELVMLSACNTAAPDGGPYAEGLSGLARAFLQAGARSLLVSHWTVSSEATVALTTAFIAAQKSAPGARRAEALRQAMLRMLTADGRHLHPSDWAPFVVVGA